MGRVYGQSLIEGYKTELEVVRMTEKDCFPEQWKRLGGRPFIKVSLWDSFMKQRLTAYIPADRFSIICNDARRSESDTTQNH